ncbi:MAG: SAM-dependent methyltransferase [Proteobacteria bacterium]|nr:SAM-dependent methyltransferase [Pseudomonadota bacterium]
MSTLPEPSLDAYLHQAKLLAHLRQIYHTKGCLNFAEFMQIVLYAPGLGYYSAGSQKFGKEGDFVTAPQISPLFSICLAKQCAKILGTLTNPCILELGAGDATMACDIIKTLSKMNLLPKNYFILEVSADLKGRQQNTLQAQCPDFFERIIWLDSLPEDPFNGIILGNEVLDAMPVHLFKIAENNQILEAQIKLNNEKWQCEFKTATTSSLANAVDLIQESLEYPMTCGYTSEINLDLAPWLASVSKCLSHGVILFIDYGFSQQEYYHPSRHMGTLMCHYRHHAHPDPLQFIGLQDITAHVDFTAVAKAGIDADLSLLGFTTQGAFLLANDLLTTNVPSDPLQQLKFSQQIQQLIQPHEMGELFKVIAFGKNYEHSLDGFELKDYSHRL